MNSSCFKENLSKIKTFFRFGHQCGVRCPDGLLLHAYRDILFCMSTHYRFVNGIENEGNSKKCFSHVHFLKGDFLHMEKLSSFFLLSLQDRKKKKMGFMIIPTLS